MNFTFAICHGRSPVKDKIAYIHECIASIRKQKIPSSKYEIVIIGDPNFIDMDIYGDDIELILFDDTQKSGRWITRKKNIMTRHARFENVVYIHNHVIFDKGWYEGFLKFGNDFDVCTTPVFNFDGTDNYTWLLNPYFEQFRKALLGDPNRHEYTIPYDVKSLSKIQYMPGNYWIAKKEAMKTCPLDDRLLHAQSEDCEWSLRASLRYDFKINLNSSVTFLRKDRKPKRPREVLGNDVMSKLLSLSEEEINEYHKLQRDIFRREWLGEQKFLDEMGVVLCPS